MNFFGNSASTGSSGSQTDLGSRLYNLKQISIGNEAMVSILPDDNIVQIPVTTFGKSLLSVSTLNGLVGLLNTADTNVQVIDSGVGEINFTLDNALKMAVKNAYTEVMNELRTLSIIPTTTVSDLGSSASPFRHLYTTGISQSKTGVDNILTIQGSTNFQQGISFGDSTNVWQMYKKYNTSDLRFYSPNATEVLTLKANGNLGINTTNPSQALEVVGTIKATKLGLGEISTIPNVLQVNGNIGINSKAEAGSAILYFYNNPGIDTISTNNAGKTAIIAEGRASYGRSNLHFCVNNTQDLTTSATITDAKMTILPTGNVGIGTSTPGALLDINGTCNITGTCNVSGLTTIKNMYPAGNNLFDIGNGTNGFRDCYLNNSVQSLTNLKFVTAGTSKLMILQAGNVGIGTDTPASTLDVRGSSTISGTNNTGSLRIGVGTGVANDNSWISFIHGNTNQTDGNDRARIGTIVASGGGGNLYFTTGTAGNQTERMRISSTGLVGINNSNPNSNLTITGASSNMALSIVAPAEAYDVATASAKNAYSPKGTMVSIANTTGTASSATLIDINAYQNIYATNVYYGAVSGTAENGPANFVIGRRTGVSTWAESMRIDTSGKLCVGTTTASTDSIMTVNGNTTCIGNILPEATGTRDIGSTSLRFNLIYGSTIIDTIATRVGGSTIPFMQCMNNVQINSGQNVLWNHTTNEIPSTKFQLLIATTSVGTTSERMQLSAYRDNSYRPLQLNPTGKVIIGGSSVIPTSTLDIGGDCTIRGDLLPDATALTRKIGSSSLKFNSGYFEVLYTTSGSVSTSDRNKKTDIQPLESALDMVLKLNPVSYKYKDGTSGRTHLGLIAQEVSEVIPDCAIFVKDENGSCGLRYDQFIALLIKAVQEQDEKIKNFELQGALLPPSELKPQLVRQNAMSVDSSLNERVSNIEQRLERESIVEVKEEKSEQFELVNSLLEKNHYLELKINELEGRIERIPKVEVKAEIQESDADGLSLIETLQDRLYRSEQQIAKTDKLVKKLVSATNKLIKGNE